MVCLGVATSILSAAGLRVLGACIVTALWAGAAPDIARSQDLSPAEGAAEIQPTDSSGPPVLAELEDLALDPLQRELPSAANANQAPLLSFLGNLDAKTRKSVAKMVGGLALVLAVFLLVSMLFGKSKTPSSKRESAMQVLARTTISRTQQMQLVRLGSRLVLIAVSENRVDTLADIDDPAEVATIENMLLTGNFSFFDRHVTRNSRTATQDRQPVYEA